jgi:hypothetical protein
VIIIIINKVVVYLNVYLKNVRQKNYVARNNYNTNKHTHITKKKQNSNNRIIM